jgi:Na+-driven multidrug efflux pump
MMIGSSKTLLVQVPCAYAGSVIWGIQGVFVGMALSSFIVALLAFALTRKAVGEALPAPEPSPSPAE